MAKGRLLAYLFVVAVAAFLVLRGETTRSDEARHNREAQQADRQQTDARLLATCQALNENRAVVRNLLVSARRQTPKAMLTERAKRFYHKQISAIKPLSCGHFNRASLPGLKGGGTPKGNGPNHPP